MAVATLAQVWGAALASSPAWATTWLVGATVVDPEARTRRVVDVAIDGERVVAVGKAPSPLPAAATAVDLRGRWLMPAFTDLHVHSWGNPSPLDGPDHDCGAGDTARLMLYAGVVAFLDLGTREDLIFRWRDRQRAEGLPGADLYAAGPIVACFPAMKGAARAGSVSDGAGQVRLACSPAAARRHVAALARKRTDIVKVIYDHSVKRDGMDRATLRAIVQEAHARKLRVIQHIGTWRDAEDGVDAGVDALTHLWEEDDVPDRLLGKMKRRRVPLVPTQPVQVDLPNVLGVGPWSAPGAAAAGLPRLLDDPLLRALTTPQLRADYRKTEQYVKKAAFWLRYQGPHTADYERQLRRLHAAGVTLLAGSDSGNFGVFQGYSLHRELALMVQAGVPTWDALRAGTTRAARFLGRRVGVQPGDEASLVVLTADPVRRIEHTTHITSVIQRGVRVDRERLLVGTSVRPGPGALCRVTPTLGWDQRPRDDAAGAP